MFKPFDIPFAGYFAEKFHWIFKIKYQGKSVHDHKPMCIKVCIELFKNPPQNATLDIHANVSCQNIFRLNEKPFSH